MTTLTIPISPEIFWPVLWITLLAAATYAVYGILPRYGASTPWLDKLRDRLGLNAVDGGFFVLGFVLYLGLFSALLGGLALLLAQTVSWSLTEMRAAAAAGNGAQEFLFYVLRIAGLTTVLAAVVAFPIQLFRLRLTNEQTRTAEAALFNDKINAALEDLYSRRQVTRPIIKDGSCIKHQDHWEDDITRRNTAIDRLERLAGENPDFAPDITRILAIYVRERSREHPETEAPEPSDEIAFEKWRNGLNIPTDMENAVQTIGRLLDNSRIRDKGIDLPALEIDLRKTNLQGFRLRGCFDKVHFEDANMQGARLDSALLREAHLEEAQLQGADLEAAQLQGRTSTTRSCRGHVSEARSCRGHTSQARSCRGHLNSWALNCRRAYLNAKLQGTTKFGGAKLQGAHTSHMRSLTSRHALAQQISEVPG